MAMNELNSATTCFAMQLYPSCVLNNNKFCAVIIDGSVRLPGKNVTHQALTFYPNTNFFCKG